MIGVAISPGDRETAREFFELCKTPWEFQQTGVNYDVLLCTMDPGPVASAKLVLVYSATATTFDDRNGFRPARSRPLVARYSGRRLPLYRGAATFSKSACQLVTDETGGEPVIAAQEAGNATIVRIGYDLFEEIRFALETGQPPEYARSASVELHLMLLRELVARAGLYFVEIPPVPDRFNLIACLTHDVDHPSLRNHWFDHTMFGFVYRSTLGSLVNACRGRIPWDRVFRNWRAAARLPLIQFGLATDFWGNFDRYLAIEAGRHSTFFVIPYKDRRGRTADGAAPSRRACRYEPAELSRQLEALSAAGCEVALHGLDAWLDPDDAIAEREHLNREIRTTSAGIRMHWLYFDGRSPSRLENAGFAYDSTVGYNETVGFRAGTTQIYRPAGTHHILELPLHVMDTALFYPAHLNLTEKEAREVVGQLVGEVAHFGGAFTLNWHDRSIAPERYWDDFYVALLHQLDDYGAWFATASQATAWFDQRRRATLQTIRNKDGAMTIVGRLDSTDANLPGLRIRVHQPCVRLNGTPLAEHHDPRFVDTPFHQTTQITMTV